MSPTPSRTNSPLDDEDKAEELCLQKKREERARREAELKAEAEEEAKEEKKKQEAEEKKRKEEEEKKKKEEEEERVWEEEQKRKEDEDRAEKEARRKEELEKEQKERSEREEQESRVREYEDWAKLIGSFVRDSIARREQEKEKGKEADRRPICDDSVVYVGRKQKHSVMMAAPAGDPDGDDPYPGDNSSEPNSDEEKDDEDSEADPSPSPRKPSKCDRCISKSIPCKMIGQGSASCQACRKAKVKCSLVGNERKIRRSKRTKREESPIASSSSLRIKALEEHNRILDEQNQMLHHRLYVMEDMVRYILQNLPRQQEFEGEESEED
ncbi:hypothetical protein F5050DRAFT_1812901 [Lentinula boryana]|uniref:Zn(2)-C6 fungal-type domain-containing protein n=1 Tax=Lentinula boryana TaxID=40481 RepID=A0ABQ8PZU5_9AGAR|nr:hypothetical protein F5050DRAFT_1812901 [Lentinula boryana]